MVNENNEELPPDGSWEVVHRLTKDMKSASRLIGRRQARFLVDRYYQIQDRRIRDAGQIRSQEGEPNQLLDWMFDSDRFLEKDIMSALNVFTKEYKVGNWLQSIVGIGPVITAGLLAHLSVNPWKCAKAKPPKCNEKEPCKACQCGRVPIKTAGHFWSFAGLSSEMKWEKGQRRPFNAFLRTLVAFKAGESFVKVQNNENDTYGKLFVGRKAIEIEKNIALKFKDQAEAKLAKFKIGKDTDAYKAYSIGMLPPAHIHARARRWTAKIFLSHLHHVMYFDYFGEVPPVPYIFTKAGEDHRHYIPIPNWPYDGPGKSLRELV